MFVMVRLSLLIALATVPALAGEYAVFTSGFRLYIERHEKQGDMVRLHLKQGDIEAPAAQIAGFEPDDYVPPPPVIPPALESRLSPEDLVTQAAARNGFPDPAILHAVASVESAYRPDAVSNKGAIGLMQLMPETARELSADPANPEQNADAGARYLRGLLLKYKDDPWQVRKALAGYNAGPGAVDRYNGVPPFRETQRYVERVLRKYAELKK